MTTDTIDLLSGDKPQGTSSVKKSGAEILAQLVGEGKPFKSVEDLAASKATGDEFIETLKSENKEMRELLNKAGTSEQTNQLLQELLAKVGQASPEGDGGNHPVAGNGALTREDIVTLVQGQVTEVEAKRAKES